MSILEYHNDNHNANDDDDYYYRYHHHSISSVSSRSISRNPTSAEAIVHVITTIRWKSPSTILVTLRSLLALAHQPLMPAETPIH
jgi:hypothetical protein